MSAKFISTLYLDHATANGARFPQKRGPLRLKHQPKGDEPLLADRFVVIETFEPGRYLLWVANSDARDVEFNKDRNLIRPYFTHTVSEDGQRRPIQEDSNVSVDSFGILFARDLSIRFDLAPEWLVSYPAKKDGESITGTGLYFESQMKICFGIE